MNDFYPKITAILNHNQEWVIRTEGGVGMREWMATHLACAILRNEDSAIWKSDGYFHDVAVYGDKLCRMSFGLADEMIAYGKEHPPEE